MTACRVLEMTMTTTMTMAACRVLEMARARVGAGGGTPEEVEGEVQAAMGRILVTTPSSVDELVRCFQVGSWGCRVSAAPNSFML